MACPARRSRPAAGDQGGQDDKRFVLRTSLTGAAGKAFQAAGEALPRNIRGAPAAAAAGPFRRQGGGAVPATPFQKCDDHVNGQASLSREETSAAGWTRPARLCRRSVADAGGARGNPLGEDVWSGVGVEAGNRVWSIMAWRV
jgi:hypothetical protein